MCRYGINPNYRNHYICIPCRNHKKGGGFYATKITPVCEFCGEEMINMGMDFHAPRKKAINQWKKVDLIKNTKWGSCGCDGPGRKPKTYAGAKNGY